MANGYISTGSNQDNTGRVLTFDYQAITDAATIALVATAYNTVFNISPLGANTTLTINTTSTFGIGSNVTILMKGDITSPIADYTVTFSTGFEETGVFTLHGGRHGVAKFVFNGDAWIQISNFTEAGGAVL